jgi:hypothetical protein
MKPCPEVEGGEACRPARAGVSLLLAWPPRARSLAPLTHSRPLSPDHHQNHSDALELLEEKLRELASIPVADARRSDDRAVALGQMDALRRELAASARTGLPGVVFGKVREERERERERERGRARGSHSRASHSLTPPPNEPKTIKRTSCATSSPFAR